jgi:UDP-N-acetylglucosamine 2-epimerase (non-hydrolysing)
MPPLAQISFLKPFGFFDYVHLQLRARCVLSDSGTLTEEAALLGFPAVMLRDAHERPEGMDAGTLVMAGLEADRVLRAVDLVAGATGGARGSRVADYEDLQVSQKVVRIIHSYVDYVNRTVWKK